VLAARVKGEVSWVPVAGFVTVMSEVAADETTVIFRST
jgi:hypothetical protein